MGRTPNGPVAISDRRRPGGRGRQDLWTPPAAGV